MWEEHSDGLLFKYEIKQFKVSFRAYKKPLVKTMQAFLEMLFHYLKHIYS